MAVNKENMGMEKVKKKSGYCGSTNTGGEQASTSAIDNTDPRRRFIDNSAHAINRKKK